jgi:hypothetical protein
MEKPAEIAGKVLGSAAPPCPPVDLLLRFQPGRTQSAHDTQPLAQGATGLRIFGRKLNPAGPDSFEVKQVCNLRAQRRRPNLPPGRPRRGLPPGREGAAGCDRGAARRGTSRHLAGGEQHPHGRALTLSELVARARKYLRPDLPSPRWPVIGSMRGTRRRWSIAALAGSSGALVSGRDRAYCALAAYRVLTG